MQSGDTPALIAAALTSAINANANLQAVAVSATASGQVITLNSNSLNETTYRASTNSTATEVVALNIPPNGVQTAAVGGTITAGDTLTVTVFDAGLSGGSKVNTYTVQSGDTLASVATGIAAMLNGDSSLTGIGVSAAAVSTVVNISSASVNATTYSRATSGGATETLALAPATAATQYGYNNLNELTSIGAGGATRFQGSANKALTAATINGSPANLEWTQAFSGNANLSSGNNAVPVSGTDGAGTTKTDTHQIATIGSPSATPTFDANGNMTSDGTNTYEWDAENRLIKINYPGSGNRSEFVLDAMGRNVRNVEFVAGSISELRQYVWANGYSPKEHRSASGAVVSQYMLRGFVRDGINYFYSKDHLGSVRAVSDTNGNIRARYEFDSYGRKVELEVDTASDIQFAGYYLHVRSQLNMTRARLYKAEIGRWINRDPIDLGVNSYAYIHGSPLSSIDPSGLWQIPAKVSGWQPGDWITGPWTIEPIKAWMKEFVEQNKKDIPAKCRSKFRDCLQHSLTSGLIRLGTNSSEVTDALGHANEAWERVRAEALVGTGKGLTLVAECMEGNYVKQAAQVQVIRKEYFAKILSPVRFELTPLTRL
ncbi:MAG: hypothetical protein HC888_03815 [Candidatus Competibacteraceae bacterium]|nr:hypothetical protein [Candidatus Competibacteraceae bacterium]